MDKIYLSLILFEKFGMYSKKDLIEDCIIDYQSTVIHNINILCTYAIRKWQKIDLLIQHVNWKLSADASIWCKVNSIKALTLDTSKL